MEIFGVVSIHAVEFIAFLFNFGVLLRKLAHWLINLGLSNIFILLCEIGSVFASLGLDRIQVVCIQLDTCRIEASINVFARFESRRSLRDRVSRVLTFRRVVRADSWLPCLV